MSKLLKLMLSFLMIFTSITVTNAEEIISSSIVSDLVVGQDPETSDIIFMSDNTDYLDAINQFILVDENGEWQTFNVYTETDYSGPAPNEANASLDGNRLRVYYGNMSWLYKGTSFNNVLINANGYTRKEYGPFTLAYGTIDSSGIAVEISQDPSTYNLLITSDDTEYIKSIHYINMHEDITGNYNRGYEVRLEDRPGEFDGYLPANASISEDGRTLSMNMYLNGVPEGTMFKYITITSINYSDKEFENFTNLYGLKDSKDINVTLSQDPATMDLIIYSDNTQYIESLTEFYSPSLAHYEFRFEDEWDTDEFGNSYISNSKNATISPDGTTITFDFDAFYSYVDENFKAFNVELYANGYSNKVFSEFTFEYGYVNPQSYQLTFSQTDDETFNFVISSEEVDYLKSLTNINLSTSSMEEGIPHISERIRFERIVHSDGIMGEWYEEPNAYLSEDGKSVYIHMPQLNQVVEGTVYDNITIEATYYNTKFAGPFTVTNGLGNPNDVDVNISQLDDGSLVLSSGNTGYLEAIHAIHFKVSENEYIYAYVYKDGGNLNAYFMNEGMSLVVREPELLNYPQGKVFESVEIFASGYAVKNYGSYTLEVGGADVSDIIVTVSQDSESANIIISSENPEYLREVNRIRIFSKSGRGECYYYKDNVDMGFRFDEEDQTITIPFETNAFLYQGENYDIRFTANSYVEKVIENYTLEYGMKSTEGYTVSFAQDPMTKDLLITSENTDFISTLNSIWFTDPEDMMQGWRYDIRLTDQPVTNETGDVVFYVKPKNADLSEDGKTVRFYWKNFDIFEAGKTLSIALAGKFYVNWGYGNYTLTHGVIDSSAYSVTLSQDPTTFDLIVSCDDADYLRSIRYIHLNSLTENMYSESFEIVTEDYMDEGGNQYFQNVTFSEDGKTFRLGYSNMGTVRAGETYNVVIGSKGYSDKVWGNYTVEFGFKDSNNVDVTLSQDPYTKDFLITSTTDYISSIRQLNIYGESMYYWFDIYTEDQWATDENGNPYKSNEKNAEIIDDGTTLRVYWRNINSIIEDKTGYVYIYSRSYTDKYWGEYTFEYGVEYADDIVVEFSQDPITKDLLISSENSRYISKLNGISFYNDSISDWVNIYTEDQWNTDMYGNSYLSNPKNAQLSDDGKTVRIYWENVDFIPAGSTFEIRLFATEYTEKNCGLQTFAYGVLDAQNIQVTITQNPDTKDVLITSEDTDFIDGINQLTVITGYTDYGWAEGSHQIEIKSKDKEMSDEWGNTWIDEANSTISEDGKTLIVPLELFYGVLTGTVYEEFFIYSVGYTAKMMEDIEIEYGCEDSTNIPVSMYQLDEESLYIIVESDNIDYLKSITHIEVTTPERYTYIHVRTSYNQNDNSGINAAIEGNRLIIDPNEIEIPYETNYEAYIRAKNYTNKIITGRFDYARDQWIEKERYTYVYPTDNLDDGYTLTYNEDTGVYTLKTPKALRMDEFGGAYPIALYEFNEEKGRYDESNGRYVYLTKVDDTTYTFTNDDFERNPFQGWGDGVFHIGIKEDIGYTSVLRTFTDEPIYLEELPTLGVEDQKEIIRGEINLTYEDGVFTLKHKDNLPLNFYEENGEETMYLQLYSDNFVQASVYLTEQPNNVYTFTLDDFSCVRHGGVIEADYYTFVGYIVIEGDDFEKLYLLNEEKIYLPTLGYPTFGYNLDVDDSELSISYVPESETYYIQTNQGLWEEDVELHFAEKIYEDEFYAEFKSIGVLELAHLYRANDELYYFSKDEIRSGEDVIPEGEYEIFYNSNYEFYRLTKNGKFFFEQSHTYLPEGAKAIGREDGIYVTTENPLSVESQNWFDAILNQSICEDYHEYQWEPYHTLIEFDDRTLNRNSDECYFEAVLDENEQIIGLLIKNSYLVHGAVVPGNHKFELGTPGYQKLVTSLEVKNGAIDAEAIEVTITQDPETKDLIIHSDNAHFLQKMRNIRLDWMFINDTSWIDIYYEDFVYDGPDDYWEQSKNAELSEDGKTARIYFSAFNTIPTGTKFKKVFIESLGYTEKCLSRFTLKYGANDSSEITDLVIFQDPETSDLLFTSENTDYISSIKHMFFFYNEDRHGYDIYLEEEGNASLSEDGKTLRLKINSFNDILEGQEVTEFVLVADGYTEKMIGDFTFVYGAKDATDINVIISQSEEEPHRLMITSDNADYLRSITGINMMVGPDDWRGFGIHTNPNGEYYNAAIIDDTIIVKYEELQGIPAGTHWGFLESDSYAHKDIHVQMDYDYDYEYEDPCTDIYPGNTGDGYILVHDEQTGEYTITSINPIYLRDDKYLDLIFFAPTDDEQTEFGWYTGWEIEVEKQQVNDMYVYTFRHENFQKRNERFDANNYHVGMWINLGYENRMVYLTHEPIWFDSVDPFTYDELDLVRDQLQLTYDSENDLFTLTHVDGLAFEPNMGFGPDDEFGFAFSLFKEVNECNVFVRVNQVNDYTYTFTSKDFDSYIHGWVINAGEYQFVVDAHVFETDTWGSFAVTNEPMFIPQIGYEYVNLNDFNMNYSVRDFYEEDGTYYIEVDGDIEVGGDIILAFMTKDQEVDYERYILNGAVELHKIDSLGDGVYAWTKREYKTTDVNIVPAGEYELFLLTNDVFYDITKGDTHYFDQSHKYLPEGATIVGTDTGVRFTTADPLSEESQAWFNNILANIFEEGDEHINDDFYNTWINIDYTGFVGDFGKDTFTKIYDENGNLIGLEVDYEKTIAYGVPKGIVTAFISTPGYQTLWVEEVETLQGAKDVSDYVITITQEEVSKNLYIACDDVEFLKSITNIFMGHPSLDYTFGEPIRNNVLHEDDYNAVLNENKGVLKVNYDVFSRFLTDVNYNITLTATGYAPYETKLGFNLYTETINHPDIDPILTSKGLIIRSMDREYLEALNTVFDLENSNKSNVSVSFQKAVNVDEFTLENHDEDGNPVSIFSGVHQYSDPSKGYYTYISSDVLANSLARKDVPYILYITAPGYLDNHFYREAFDVTKIINLYEEIKNAGQTPDMDILNEFDRTVTSLPNVGVGVTFIEDGQEVPNSSIDVYGGVAATVVSDNKGDIDESTLAFEDGEMINVELSFDHKENTSESADFSDGEYKVLDIMKTFDIELSREIDGGNKEVISELPLHVFVTFDYYLDYNKNYKVLRTHTNENGQVVKEFLDVERFDYTFSSFYTDQFSTFELVEVQEIKDVYTVTFGEDWEDFGSVEVPTGQTVQPIETPTKEGYKFLGWYFKGQLFDFENTAIERDLTLHARWVSTDPGRTGTQVLNPTRAQSFVGMMTGLAYFQSDLEYTTSQNAPAMSVYYATAQLAYALWQEYLGADEWTYYVPFETFMAEAHKRLANVNEAYVKQALISRNNEHPYYDEDTDCVIIALGGLGDSACYELDTIEILEDSYKLHIRWFDHADQETYYYAVITLHGSNEYGLRVAGFEKFDEPTTPTNSYNLSEEFVAYDNGVAYARIMTNTNKGKVVFGQEYTLKGYAGNWYSNKTVEVPFEVNVAEFCQINTDHENVEKVTPNTFKITGNNFGPLSINIEVTDHQSDNWTVTTEPTCTTKGEKSGFCNECERDVTVSVSALGHSYNENGVCSICGTLAPNISVNVSTQEVVVEKQTAEQLSAAVDNLVNNVITGEEVEGIQEETKEVITEALENKETVDIVTTIVAEPVQSEAIDPEITQEIESRVEESTIVTYLDLSISLDVYVNEQLVQKDTLTVVQEAVEFTIPAPTDLEELPLGFDRQYFIIREHDGAVETIPVTVNADGSLTFTTDRFSVYALGYVDSQKEIESIEFKSLPEKTTYVQYKETLDLSQITLFVQYSDGTSDIVEVTEDMMGGFDNEYVGEQYVWVEFNGYGIEFVVEVIPLEVTSIEVTTLPTKTTYQTGEELDLTGGILSITLNEIFVEEIDLSEVEVTGFDSETEGEKTLTVTFGEFTTTFVVKVQDFIYGDVNGDGVVSPTDLTFLARYLAEWTDYPASRIDSRAADVNGDGEVTPTDCTILARHLAEWSGYETLPYGR